VHEVAHLQRHSIVVNETGQSIAAADHCLSRRE
jgi:hypothetical protein